MTSAVERRYRRVLRLLPADYRHAWGEDMVTAFMEGDVASNRRTWAERLSVVSLAVRLRLNGSHASPRGLVWYHLAHAFALLVLLYQAVSATVTVAFGVGVVTYDPGGGFNPGFLFSFDTLSGLPWVAAFACFVAGRYVAARWFGSLAAVSAIAFMVYVVAINDFNPEPIGVSDLSRWGWLAISLLAVYVTPSGARASRRLWTAAYVVGSAVGSVLASRAFSPGIARYLEWAHRLGLVDVACAGLAIAMVVALATAWWTRSPHWLLSLAATAGGIAGVRLLRMQTRTLVGPLGQLLSYPWEQHILSVTLAVLATLCAAVGLLRWYRMPARTRS